MTFAEVMDRVGLDATSRQYGEAFRDSKYSLWHANASARKWLNRGIEAPLSGHPKYNLHANDIDFQIESDFIGLMTPGLPREANWFCDRVGRVMNHGDGLYGGMFVTGMYAAAFFENDVRRIVEAGLASMPRRKRLRAHRPRRAGVVGAVPGRLGAHVATGRGEVESRGSVSGRRVVDRSTSTRG